MTIWELEKIANNIDKTVFGDDKSKYMLCPVCDAPASSYWGGMVCQEKHFFNCDDFLTKYLKKHFNRQDISLDEFLYIFKNSIKEDIKINDLHCLACCSPLEFKKNYLTCKNNHDISYKDYIANYVDMLDGFLKVSCDYLKDEIVK